MPPRYVRTIREELQYEYAKLMCRTVFNGQLNYGFITDRFKALRDGGITISGTIREWEKEAGLPKLCVFCGTDIDLQRDHLIPSSRGGSDDANNVVWSCQTCNVSRGDKGVYEWLGLKKKDHLHRLVAGKYLKQLFDLHEKKSTLDVRKDDIQKLCSICRNKRACVEWGKVEQLTCFCLESVF